MKLTLTYVRGEQKISPRTNKPYESLSLKSTEYGDRFLSGFGSKETMNWKIGDVVEVEVVESDKIDKTGKPYLNWSLPKKPTWEDELAKVHFSIANIHRKIDQIVEHLKEKNTTGLTSAGTKVPDFTPNTDEQAEEFVQKMEQYESLNSDLNAIAEEQFAIM